jgi:hypothetical protein
MNWAWTTSLDQFWHSPDFPAGLPLAAAGFFAFILLITLIRAQKSVANLALVVITLASLGGAVAVTMRGFGLDGRGGSGEPRASQQATAALPALSCIDELAGETVLTGCEKALFGSADAAAAAVSYASAQLSRLNGFGDVATANRKLTYELLALRRAIERDRYGVMAQALVSRDQCTPSQCAAFRSLTDPRQIVSNMTERTYDGLIARYAPAWNAPAAAPVAALGSSLPTGKPTNADFPTAASTPPVNIMTPEPGSAPPPARAATRAVAPTANPAAASASLPAASADAPAAAANAPATAANAALLSPRPTSSAAPATLAAAKKQPSPKRGPVQLAPTGAAATAND